jgi:hypothetical protein
VAMNPDQLTAQVLGLGQRIDDLVSRLGAGHVVGTGAVPITSTTPDTIISFDVEAGGTYRIWGSITGTEGASASQVHFQMNGPTAVHMRVNFKLYGGPLTGVAQTPFVAQIGAMNTRSDPLPNGNNIPIGGVFLVEFDGVLAGMASDGTVDLRGGEHTSGMPWTADEYCWLDWVRQA